MDASEITRQLQKIGDEYAEPTGVLCDAVWVLAGERDKARRDLSDVVGMLRELERETYIRGVSERARLLLDRFPPASPPPREPSP